MEEKIHVCSHGMSNSYNTSKKDELLDLWFNHARSTFTRSTPTESKSTVHEINFTNQLSIMHRYAARPRAWSLCFD